MNGADFNPPRLLRNPHVQSVLASSGVRRFASLRRGDGIEARAVEHILDCGEGVRLQGFHTPQRAVPEARGLVVLLHGWEGSARSSSMPAVGARAATRSAKLPPSEKPATVRTRGRKRDAASRTALTTSSMRHEWKISRLRWCVSP